MKPVLRAGTDREAPGVNETPGVTLRDHLVRSMVVTGFLGVDGLPLRGTWED